MKKAIRQARKAKKILTEFDLRNGRKLRIYVYFWGNEEYAKKLGFHGNTVYKPVLIGKNGFERNVYKGNKGLPTLDELRRFYEGWNEKLARTSDKKRLKEIAKTLLELAEISTYFNGRQAHVIYQLLRITRGGPTFRITKPSQASHLDVRLEPAIVVSFRGYKSFKPLTFSVYGTKFFDALKALRQYDDQIEEIATDLRHDLAEFAEHEGPIINLDVLADHAEDQVKRIFAEECASRL